jgi:PAS domain-containing protein
MLRAGAQDFVAKDSLARLRPAILRELEQGQVRRERLRALTERMPALLWTTDSELRITSATGAALAAIGLSSDESASASSSRHSFCMRRRWRRSDASRGDSRTTSTAC